MKPTIVGSFNAANAPEGAEYAYVNPTGEFVQTFLRQKTHKPRTDENRTVTNWYFWSSIDNWCVCLYPEQIIRPDCKFLKVEQW
jgi:hypothetical protein